MAVRNIVDGGVSQGSGMWRIRTNTCLSALGREWEVVVAGLVALTRVRNEELVIEDTIRHLSSFADGIVVYDDDSTDRTVDLIHGMDAPVLEVIKGTPWSVRRQTEETRHRALLLERGRASRADWLIYMDADERLDGDPRALMEDPRGADGFRFRLFDAYLSPQRHEPYRGGDLSQLDRSFGPECRSILMMWRSGRKFAYLGSDQREPVPRVAANVANSDIAVKHYGKAISIAQWEETCRYYSEFFPEPYKSKWAARAGMPLHEVSDQGFPLVSFSEAKSNPVHVGSSVAGLRGLGRRLQVSARAVLRR